MGLENLRHFLSKRRSPEEQVSNRRWPLTSHDFIHDLKKDWFRVAKKVFSSEKYFRESMKVEYWDDVTSKFSGLRGRSLEKQKEFFCRLFGAEGLKFPNSEKLGSFIAEVNNIHWFSPNKQPNVQILQQSTDAHLKALNLQPLPIRLINNDWIAAWDVEWVTRRTPSWFPNSKVAVPPDPPASVAIRDAKDEVRSVARAVRLDVVSELAGTLSHVAALSFKSNWAWRVEESAKEDTALIMAQSTKLGPIRSSQWYGALTHFTRAIEGLMARALGNVYDDVERTGEWIIVENFMQESGYPGGNPFIPLVEIYKQGFWPMGSTGNEFVIFIPKIEGGSS